MEEKIFRGVGLVILITGVLVFSLAGKNTDGNTSSIISENYTVSSLLSTLPVNHYVSVTGRVSKILPDYISRKGYKYQQFYISDSKNFLKVFCSKRAGFINVSIGERVWVRGRFQKFGNEYEIYTQCKNIKVLEE